MPVSSRYGESLLFQVPIGRPSAAANCDIAATVVDVRSSCVSCRTSHWSMSRRSTFQIARYASSGLSAITKSVRGV